VKKNKQTSKKKLNNTKNEIWECKLFKIQRFFLLVAACFRFLSLGFRLLSLVFDYFPHEKRLFQFVAGEYISRTLAIRREMVVSC